MKISELINKNLIIAELKGKSKKQILEELVNHLAGQEQDINSDDLLKVLIEREKLGSTGIGNSIAIPHGKLNGLDSIVLMLGKCEAGIDFDSIDGKPVNLVFLLVAPASSAGVHLKALARLSRLLKNGAFRQALLDAPTAEGLYGAILAEDEKITA